MIEKIIRTIEKYNMLTKGDGVVVGLSGGPDSLTLMHILIALKEKYSLKIYAAHVNHCLRGSESDGDEEFVKEVCRQWNIPLYSKKIDVSDISKRNKISLEEAGRLARYHFFEEVLIETGAQKLAIAHNANDNAETILMRIIRGCGLDGLCGIKPIRDKVIRPLIEIKREEIEKYCEDLNLIPRIDSSNSDKSYTRNKIRLELIPYLEKEFNTNIINVVNRMGDIIANDAGFIDKEIEKVIKEIIIKQNEEYIILNLDKINKQSNFIIPKILRSLILKLQGNLVEIEQVNIKDLIRFINTAKNGSQYDLPKGLKVTKSYNELTIYKNYTESEKTIYNYRLNIPGTTFINQTGASIEAYFTDKQDIKLDKFIQAFDYDKINNELFIRTRNDGDIFAPSGMRGSKKLKDYFIDKKISREKRDQTPLIAVKNEIVWIVGDRISEKYRADNKTKKILILRYNL